MVTNNVFSTITTAAFCLLMLSCKKGNTSTPPSPVPPPTNIAIALAGNAYITQLATGASEQINENGLANWTNPGTITSTYFSIGQTGQLHVAIKAKVAPGGSSIVRVTVNGNAFTINLSGTEYKTWYAGAVNISAAGYVKVDLQGVSKTGTYFAEVSDIMIGGTATTSDVVFANDPANYYWSRRGPSCHLNYTTPSVDKEYFYSELTVPAGEDKIASYFMANGFGEGYFGIQVNSATERRVLFSVWDPAAGNGQTNLVKKGPDVTAGRFGGEGTGGQSYLKFDWKGGTTYKFLTRGKPDGNGSTVYTSWFFAPEAGSWRLMASWTRPNISKYLTGFHGFLENFDPNQGYLSRKADWSNQWVCLADGNWIEVTEFKFTVDATAANKQRLDCTGGVENGQFFLRNGGFFSNGVTPNTLFKKPATGIAPVIDFNSLP
jgi:hypothetical protein